MMNTVRKSENLLPFPVISAAANGDTTAMCAILKHYEGYISGGRQAGALQQPCRAQHKALCYRSEELALFQHPGRRSVQRCDLQPD